MLGDIAIPSIVDSEPMFADDYSKVTFFCAFQSLMNDF